MSRKCRALRTIFTMQVDSSFKQTCLYFALEKQENDLGEARNIFKRIHGCISPLNKQEKELGEAQNFFKRIHGCISPLNQQEKELGEAQFLFKQTRLYFAKAAYKKGGPCGPPFLFYFPLSIKLNPMETFVPNWLLMIRPSVPVSYLLFSLKSW